jgi:hypothetical protein
MNLLYSSSLNESLIQEVWKHNLKEEMLKIMKVLEKYNYISMVFKNDLINL